MLNYETMPLHENCREAIKLYFEQGIEPGGFLEAVLCNDLRMACLRADARNQFFIVDWVKWLIWEAPAASWGSKDKYQAWLAHKGISMANAKEE